MSEEFPLEETLENKPEIPVKPKRRLGRLILLGIAGILLIDTLSGFAGYQVGLGATQATGNRHGRLQGCGAIRARPGRYAHR